MNKNIEKVFYKIINYMTFVLIGIGIGELISLHCLYAIDAAEMCATAISALRLSLVINVVGLIFVIVLRVYEKYEKKF